MNGTVDFMLIIEDELSEEVAKTLIKQVAPGIQVTVLSGRGHRHGYGYIRKNINGFNRAAAGMCYFILTDLDEHLCPTALIDDWLVGPLHHNLIFRIAIREVEAWLLAHRGPFSEFLGVPKRKLPINPELEIDSKRCLINLARKSRFSSISKALVPPRGSTAKIGPGYNLELTRYVRETWDAREAATLSDSLARCIDRISAFRPIFQNKNTK